MGTSTLVDLVKIQALSSGTGAFQLGPAVLGFRGIEALVDSAQYSYSVQSGGEYEYGVGSYIAGSGTLTRTPQGSSAGGAAVPFPANVQVAFTALAIDIATGNLPITQITGTNPQLVMSQAATTNALAAVTANAVTAVLAALVATAPVFATGTKIRSDTSSVIFAVDGAAGYSKQVRFRTGSVERAFIGVTNDAETGSDAGSNFIIGTVNDAGNALKNIMVVSRATGIPNFPQGLTGITAGQINAALTYVPVAPNTAPTLATGTKIQSSGVNVIFPLDGDVSRSKTIRFRTAGIERALIGTTNDVESGSNAGSDLYFAVASDAGELTQAMFVKRATGIVNFTVAPTVGSGNPIIAWFGDTNAIAMGGYTDTVMSKVGTYAAGPPVVWGNAVTATPSAYGYGGEGIATGMMGGIYAHRFHKASRINTSMAWPGQATTGQTGIGIVAMDAIHAYVGGTAHSATVELSSNVLIYDQASPNSTCGNHVAFQARLLASAPSGATANASTTALFGFAAQVIGAAGADGYSLNGIELDIGTSNFSATATGRCGLNLNSIGQTPNTQGYYDTGINFTGGPQLRGNGQASGKSGWLTGISFSMVYADQAVGYVEPIASNGSLLAAYGTTGGAKFAVAYAFDLRGISSFSQAILATGNVKLTEGALTIISTNSSIELGSLTTANTPFIDLHSSGFNNDYDVRVSATGGSSGSSGTGTLVVGASAMAMPNKVGFGVSPVARATITGSKNGNAALASLLSALNANGMFTDSTT